MPEIIFNGPEGRLQGRYLPGSATKSPMALILHPQPQHGGTMNNKVVYNLYHIFGRRGFSVLRFNFRGVGRSEGKFDDGLGELSDAASALDWLQIFNPNSPTCWVAGFSFGAWIGMQLLMRRPEIHGFISVAPPANLYDFGFLAPCPASGIIVHGEKDEIVSTTSVVKLAEKLRTQKSITVDYEEIPGANHFFENEMPELVDRVEAYLDTRLAPAEQQKTAE
ncbi:MAG: alpha/beta hydrolase [Proteobacteria bacterium]|nr:alpha/beta hydrolase [Pseudomonadota bacterium]